METGSGTRNCRRGLLINKRLAEYILSLREGCFKLYTFSAQITTTVITLFTFDICSYVYYLSQIHLMYLYRKLLAHDNWGIKL